MWYQDVGIPLPKASDTLILLKICQLFHVFMEKMGFHLLQRGFDIHAK